MAVRLVVLLLLAVCDIALAWGPYFYSNRKKIEDADPFFAQKIADGLAIQGPSSGYVLVFDFNTNEKGLGLLNISPTDLPPSIMGHRYDSLSASAKEEYLFRPFFERLANQSQAIIVHVDHHYEFNILSQTTTTVLLYDFIDWLYSKRAELGGQKVDAVLNRLVNGYAIRDHSDADITFSHLIARRATDRDFLLKVGRYLKGTTILNDYLRGDLTLSAREQSFAQLLFDFALDIDRAIAKGTEYEEGLDLLGRAAETVERLSRSLSPGITNVERYLLESEEGWSEIDESIQVHFRRGLLHNIKVQAAFAKIFDDAKARYRAGTFGQKCAHFSGGCIWKSGRTLVIDVADWRASQPLTISLSDVLIAIYAVIPELVIDIDIAVIYFEDSGKRNVKFRGLRPEIDLSKLTKYLRGDHLRFKTAGGRPAAGSLSKYGFPASECLADFLPLERVLSGIEAVYKQ